MKFGIWSFAHMHAAGYADASRRIDDLDLTVILDEDQKRAGEMSAAFGAELAKGPDDFLSRDIDFVLVAGENTRHKDMVLAACAAGKSVLCEKPLAPTITDAKEMNAAAEKAQVWLGTSFPCRFMPAYTRLRETVRSGKLGEILALKTTNHGSCPGGWFTDPSLSGGGATMDHTVHVADLLRDLLECEAVEVFCAQNSLIRGSNTDDVGMLTITFENGVFASLDASWSRPKSFPTWGDVTMEVVGTDGTVTMDMFSQNIIWHSDEKMRTAWVHWGDSADRLMLSDFADAVREGRPPTVTGEDGLRATAIAQAAYESAASGRPVRVRHA